MIPTVFIPGSPIESAESFFLALAIERKNESTHSHKANGSSRAISVKQILGQIFEPVQGEIFGENMEAPTSWR